MSDKCPSCATAEVDAATGLYHHGCSECAARSIANSLQYAAASAAHRMLPSYRALLEKFRGSETADDFHRRVKRWDIAIKAALARRK